MNLWTDKMDKQVVASKVVETHLDQGRGVINKLNLFGKRIPNS